MIAPLHYGATVLIVVLSDYLCQEIIEINN